MPTATASFDDAFDLDEPARKRAPRKPRAAPPRGGAGRKKGKKRPRFSIDMQRVARYGAVGMSATIAAAIMVNALVLQKGHHPAPLFGKSIMLGAVTPPAAKAPSAARPAPEPTPAALEPAAAPAPAAASSQRAALAPAPDHGSTADPIGQLIEGHVPVAAKSEGRTVLGAQKALAKLGFGVKATGTMGPQTRKAIEAFERYRHLPVKGDLSHRVVRLLAAESGVKID